jgi:NhaP-type Na+/H+ and K+/H+ antiporter
MKEILNECYKLTSKLKNELKLYKCEISKDLKSLSEQLKTLDINKSVLNVFILKSKEIKEIDNALLPIQTYEDCIFVCNKEDNYKLNKELIIKYYS